MSDDAVRLAKIRDMWLVWESSRNPVLLAAAGQLRQAAGFSMTTAEVELARQKQGRLPV